jgi:dimethylamine corrinoid protein
MTSKESILKGLADSVVEGNRERAIDLANKAVKEGIDAYSAIMDGCARGMNIVSERYERREMFVPEILLSARAMNGAVDILKPHLKASRTTIPLKTVLGVVSGDIHDIGKNLVKLLLETAGITVFDLGKDVPYGKFVEKAKEEHVDMIGMSALMTTSMMGMAEVVKLAGKAVPNVKIMIGGAPVTQEYCDKIGADGYADNASKAAKLAEKLAKDRS